MTKHRVEINFGPYISFGLLEHQTARLEGLQALLLEDGHTVNFSKLPDRNIVEVIVNGETVYSCTIQEFQFGGDGKLDPVCYKVLEAVRKAF